MGFGKTENFPQQQVYKINKLYVPFWLVWVWSLSLDLILDTLRGPLAFRFLQMKNTKKICKKKNSCKIAVRPDDTAHEYPAVNRTMARPVGTPVSGFVFTARHQRYRSRLWLFESPEHRRAQCREKKLSEGVYL